MFHDNKVGKSLILSEIPNELLVEELIRREDRDKYDSKYGVYPYPIIFVAYRSDPSLKKGVHDKIINIAKDTCGEVFDGEISVMPFTELLELMGEDIVYQIHDKVINCLGIIAIVSPECLQFMWAQDHIHGIYNIIDSNKDKIEKRITMHTQDTEYCTNLMNRITSASPSSNVIYEIGLFIGSAGREKKKSGKGSMVRKAAIIRTKGTYIPTDLVNFVQATADIKPENITHSTFSLTNSSSKNIKKKLKHWMENLKENYSIINS